MKMDVNNETLSLKIKVSVHLLVDALSFSSICAMHRLNVVVKIDPFLVTEEHP